MQPQPELDSQCDVCKTYFDGAQSGYDNGYYERYCDDCHELLERAKRAISVARQDGCLKQGYHPSSWREAKNRLGHAATHIYLHKRNDTSEDHLAHAICDLVMSYDRES